LNEALRVKDGEIVELRQENERLNLLISDLDKKMSGVLEGQ